MKILGANTEEETYGHLLEKRSGDIKQEHRSANYAVKWAIKGIKNKK